MKLINYPRLAFVGLAFLFLNHAAFAAPIQGDVAFSGRLTFDTGNINTANSITGWTNTRVELGDGDFSGLAPNTPATFGAPWQFNPSIPLPGLWSVGGFTFDLLTASILQQGGGFLSIAGSGVISSTNPAFDPTPGSFHFSSQNPGVGGTFSFSAAAEVPEPPIYALLGVGILLCGQRFLRSRRSS
jgi:hypothetical protein